MQIHVIATGGTFEKHYDELTGELIFTQTHLPQMLARARINEGCTFETVCLVDSLDMTDEQRQSVLKSCQACSEKQIVIVHGTDTMCETAQLLGQAQLDKTIVLTGAMIPYEFEHSDAFFNLGVALSSVQLLPTGVYVCMNGRAFDWKNVFKNKQIGVFESLK